MVMFLKRKSRKTRARKNIPYPISLAYGWLKAFVVESFAQRGYINAIRCIIQFNGITFLIAQIKM